MNTAKKTIKPRKRAREALIGLLLAGASLLFCLFVAEVGLRLIGYQYTPMEVALNDSNPGEWRFRHAFRDGHFTYDPNIIWRPRREVYPFNGDGFRGAALAGALGEDELRLFAIGDSNTLGWLGEEGAPLPSWPLQLADFFSYGGKKLRVTNAGIYGHATFQGVRLLEELLPYKPAVVLVSYGCNDAHMVSISDADFMENTIGARLSFFNSSLFRFRTVHLAAAAWDRLFGAKNAMETENRVHRVSLEAYQANLGKMVAACEEQGVLCVLLTRPYTGVSDDPDWWSYYADAYYEATKAAARESGAALIDVCAHFAEKPSLFTDESHFTEEGHRIAAEFISHELEAILDDRSILF